MLRSSGVFSGGGHLDSCGSEEPGGSDCDVAGAVGDPVPVYCCVETLGKEKPWEEV